MTLASSETATTMASSTASLRRLQADVRQRLRARGTDVEMSDRDPTGDGDQSRIQLNHDGQQVYRDLFANGGDIAECSQAGNMSRFAGACTTGDVAYVERALRNADTDEAKPSDKLIRLLETRETSMRLSPLLLIVSAGKSVAPQGMDPSHGKSWFGFLSKGQIEVARLLLKHGARPDAKDVCGKTVCHYGAGMMATQMTMKVVTMCIHATESSYLFGREVELFGLKKENMNGKKGIARGFDTETGRRTVYVFNDQKQVALKPENIRLSNNEEVPIQTKLCDVQDRLGAVSLIEVMMTKREDVANFLLNEHGARVDVADIDDVSPQTMAVMPGADLISPVAKLVKQRVTREARAKTKAARRQCTQCSKMETTDEPLRVCARCKTAQYCSKECQTKHWKEGGHKQECKKAAAESIKMVVLEQPSSSFRQDGTNVYFIPTASNPSLAPSINGFYQKPGYVAAGERFFIKLQCTALGSPIMIYDKTRQCQFCYGRGQRGYAELYEKIQEERAFDGKKTYLEASFDDTGKCTVYLGTATLKTW